MSKSKIEERQKEILQEETIPITFKDKNEEEFKAKSDAILENSITGQLIIVEFKDGDLNTTGSINTAENTLRNRCRRYGLSTTGNHYELGGRLWNSGKQPARNAYQQHSWSNSIIKQSIVSKGVQEIGMQFLLVFHSHSPIKKYYGREYSFQDFYFQKYDLTVMLERDFNKKLRDGTWRIWEGELE